MTDTNEPTEIARRLALAVSTAMNVSALMANEAALAACDHAELRAELASMVDELRWMRSLASTSGIYSELWPADADARIASLDTIVAAWNPSEPISQDAVASARRALEMLGGVAGA